MLCTTLYIYAQDLVGDYNLRSPIMMLDKLNNFDCYKTIQYHNKLGKLTIEKQNPDHEWVHDSTMHFRPNNDNILVGVRRVEHFYEENKDVDLHWYFDHELEKWKVYAYEVFHFNDHDQITEYTEVRTELKYEGFPETNPYEKLFYYYDSDQKLTLIEKQDDEDLKVNRIGERTFYDYNEDEQLERFTVYRKFSEEDTLAFYREVCYKYHPDRRLNYYVESRFSIKTGFAYRDSSFIYYDKDLRIDFIEKYSTRTTEEYALKATRIRRYDSESNVREEVEYRYYNHPINDTISNNSWQNSFSPNLNLLTRSSFDSLVDAGAGAREYLTVFNYDESIHNDKILRKRIIPDVVFSDFTVFQHSHMILEDNSEYFWEPYFNFKRKYYYSRLQSTSTDNEPEADLAIEIYPVPGRDFITITTNDSFEYINVTLYDKLGQKVLEENMISGEMLDISGLPSGIYSCSILVNEALTTRLIIKH